MIRRAIAACSSASTSVIAATSSDVATVHARSAVGLRRVLATSRPSSGASASTKDSGEASSTTKENEAPVPPLRPRTTSSGLESLPVTFADISRAHVAIRHGVKRTPTIKSYFLSELLGANIFLKTEFQQFTGSFKERGARNAILTLLRERGDKALRGTGVIAASAGNHALALAYHGKDLEVPVRAGEKDSCSDVLFTC